MAAVIVKPRERVLKEDEYYIAHHKAKCDGLSAPQTISSQLLAIFASEVNY